MTLLSERLGRWARGAARLLPPEVRADNLAALLFPRRHFPLIAVRRAALIASRVRLIAALFAVLTPAWIVLDWAAFPHATAAALAAGRLAACGAFALLALAFRRAESARGAYAALALLYAVPTAFFVYSFDLLHHAPAGPYAAMMTGVYSFVPVIAIAGLSLFPLTALEVLLFAAPVFAAEAVVDALHIDAFDLSARLGVYWMLVLITGVAALACMSQLAFVVALMGQSMRDRLTGCFSRASIEELLELQFVIARRANAPLALAFVDLDNFKSVNDVHGHEAGDRVLAAAGERLQRTLRRGDMVGRWGGEEFIVVFPNATAAHAAAAVERLRAAGLGARPDGRPVTASIGLADNASANAGHWKELVEAADRRMYRAKLAGKDRVVTGDEGVPGALLAGAAAG